MSSTVHIRMTTLTVVPAVMAGMALSIQRCMMGETEVVDKLFRILETAFTQVVSMSRKQKIPMRMAALTLGIKRVQEAKRIRGLFP